MTKLFLDGRPAQKAPHSYRRLLELFIPAAQQVDLSVELLTDGPLHPECEQFSSLIHSSSNQVKEDAKGRIWSMTPDSPLVKTDRNIATICDVNPLLADGRNVMNRWLRGHRFKKKVDHRIRDSFRIATDSKDAENRLIESFPAIKKLIRVVPLYAAASFKPASNAQLKILDELTIKPGYIFFVGSFRRHKNWDGLMRSFAKLPDSLKRAHPLVLSGPVRRDLQQATRLIDELGIQEHTRILNETAEKYMPALYSGAKLFVFPSFMEGFGLPPLEAMQCGTPVIASDRTSIPEVLGDAARYVDPADLTQLTNTLREMLENIQLCESYASKGLNQATTFNAERTGLAIMNLLR